MSKELTMTAEATGVKKIAVTFNQAVDTTTTKIVVKKGSATPTIAATTPAEDAKSYEIAMGAKLTAGTYTVEATVGEKVLTADITVKDETMTAFQLVSTNLVATATSSGAATISYKAVNQYGEAMAASNVTASCSFGTVSKDAAKTTTPTADKNGKVTVEGIPATLAIDGQTGTLVLVNNENGVSLNETVTYRSKAVAASAEVLGIYSEKTQKVIENNLKVGATVSDYKILVNIQDQYGSDMNAEAIADSASNVSLNPASVLTDLTVKSEAKTIDDDSKTEFADISYDGKNCIAIPLETPTGKIAKAGTLSLTIVGANKGVLATPSFTVDDVVLIESFSVSATDTVYNNVDNKLAVEAVDVNGNSVTKYDDLMAAFGKSTGTFTDYVITLKKNSDGTGTFYYKPTLSLTTDKQNASMPATVMFYANEPTSGKYIVKPVSFTVYEAQVIKKVAGLASDAVTAVAVSEGAILALNPKKLILEDQYSNTKAFEKISTDDKAKISAFIVDSKNIFSDEPTSAFRFDTDKNLTVSAGITGTTNSARLYLKFDGTASADNYDTYVDLYAVSVDGITKDDLTVTVNDGKTVYAENGVTLKAVTAGASQDDKNDTSITVVVTAKVSGKNVVIPNNKVTIIDEEIAALGALKDGEKTETKTIRLGVDSENGTVPTTAEVTVSNAASKATTLKASSNTSVSGSDVASTDGLLSTITIKDQYGIGMVGTGKVVYTVTPTGTDASKLTVSKNATQKATITGGTSGVSYTASVTYEYGGLTFTQDVTINF